MGPHHFYLSKDSSSLLLSLNLAGGPQGPRSSQTRSKSNLHSWVAEGGRGNRKGDQCRAIRGLCESGLERNGVHEGRWEV